MTLSALIKKGGLTCAMTATPVTAATQEVDKPITVATVASVAVAENLEPVSEMSAERELSIRTWFAHIGETNLVLVDDIIDRCRTEIPLRTYLLKRAKEVQVIWEFPKYVHCADCINFKRIDHPHLGHCAQGQPEAVAGLWDDHHRICDHFTLKNKVIGDHHDQE